MASVTDFFENEKAKFLVAERNFTYQVEPVLEAKIYCCWHHPSHSTFLMMYIPEHPQTNDVIFTVMAEAQEILEGYQVSVGFGSTNETSLYNEPRSPLETFTRTIYFYYETPLTIKQIKAFGIHAKEQNLIIHFRDKTYADKQTAAEKPDAFICHDSRDKDEFVRPLVREISANHRTVWFDEYSLKVGDSLREGIENGIRVSKKCVLVITSNFLNNTGWTKAEFDSIIQKHIDEGMEILPVWIGVNSKEVREYSTILKGIVAANWEDGPEAVGKKLAEKLRLEN